MPDPIDLSGYSDDDLADLRTQVGAEIVRRAQKVAVPDQVQELLTAYTQAGGDVEALGAATSQAAQALAHADHVEDVKDTVGGLLGK